MKNIPKIQLNENKPYTMVDPVKTPRSVFDLSQSVLTTINPDIVYPLMWEEIIPADTFKIKTKIGARAATPIYPIMDNLKVQCDWWYVPNRITWTHALNFWGEREIDDDQNPQTDYLVPIIDDTSKDYAAAAGTIAAQGFSFNGFFDYLLAGNDVGRPMQTSLGNYITSLLARAYMKIGYHWYWDQTYGTVFMNPAGNVESIGFIPLNYGDGPDDASTFQLYRKAKKKDYITSLRPFILTGEDGSTYLTDVLGAFVPITHATEGTLTDDIVRKTNAANPVLVRNTGAGTGPNGKAIWADVNVNNNKLTDSTGTDSYNLDPNGTLQLNLENIGVSINNIRLYEQIQKYYERSTRAGQRYVERTFATYGVTPEDSRLQLPEWLGGFTERVNYSPVAATSDSGAATIGDLAAFGTLIANGPTITKSFSEHGYILCLVSVFPDLTYQTGIDRKLLRRTPYDFHDPLWENLTEQLVTQRELSINNSSADGFTLGYAPRFSEMKFGRRKLSGLMRLSNPLTLDSWHYSQDVQPNQDMDAVFRCYDTDIGRTQAVTDQPALIVYAEAEITAARPLQVNPVPLLGGY